MVQWFDKPPSLDTSGASPVYTPRQQGMLSKFGNLGSSMLAPWKEAYGGNMNYQLAQQKLQMEQDAMDMEFQKYLTASGAGKPIFIIDPVTGQPIPVGVIPKGGQVVTNPNAPTADQKNMLKATQQAATLFEELKARSESLKSGYEGMYEVGKAALNRGSGESAKYRTYMSNLPATSVAFYRAITGDTRLSDADAQARALPLLWNPSEAEDVRSDKNNFLGKMISAREKLLSSGNYQDGEIPWSDVLTAAQGGAKTTKTAVPGDTSSQRIRVISPDGKVGNIPANQLEEALKAGYKRK